MWRRPFSRHDGFFASLQRVEDRLASEQPREQRQDPLPPPAPVTASARQSEPSPFSDTMATASPLLLLDPAPPSAPASRDSSGPALDFLTAHIEHDQSIQQDDGGGGGVVEEDIARLMALLALSPPPPPPDGDGEGDDGTGGCDCSGADGFMARVVGVAGPKCDGEKRRLDAWIRHYHRGGGGGCRVREPARLAHLLLARASSDAAAVASPATVKEFLDRDPPRQTTD